MSYCHVIKAVLDLLKRRTGRLIYATTAMLAMLAMFLVLVLLLVLSTPLLVALLFAWKVLAAIRGAAHWILQRCHIFMKGYIKVPACTHF